MIVVLEVVLEATKKLTAKKLTAKKLTAKKLTEKKLTPRNCSQDTEEKG